MLIGQKSSRVKKSPNVRLNRDVSPRIRRSKASLKPLKVDLKVKQFKNQSLLITSRVSTSEFMMEFSKQRKPSLQKMSEKQSKSWLSPKNNNSNSSSDFLMDFLCKRPAKAKAEVYTKEVIAIQTQSKGFLTKRKPREGTN
jgi:hypothetical protein